MKEKSTKDILADNVKMVPAKEYVVWIGRPTDYVAFRFLSEGDICKKDWQFMICLDEYYSLYHNLKTCLLVG